jgi:hypothetical protein
MIDVLYAEEFVPEIPVKIDPPRWIPLEYPVQNAEALA